MRSGSVLLEVGSAPGEETESAGNTPPATVTVPWSPPPSRARREVLAPASAETEHLKPMRSDTRQTLLVAIAKAWSWFIEL